MTQQVCFKLTCDVCKTIEYVSGIETRDQRGNTYRYQRDGWPDGWVRIDLPAFYHLRQADICGNCSESHNFRVIYNLLRGRDEEIGQEEAKERKKE